MNVIMGKLTLRGTREREREREREKEREREREREEGEGEGEEEEEKSCECDGGWTRPHARSKARSNKFGCSRLRRPGLPPILIDHVFAIPANGHEI